MRAIAQDPRDRYASARSLADDLDKWLLRHRIGKLRLSFSVTTIILGLAAALLLVIGIRTALVPWNGPARPAQQEDQVRTTSPSTSPSNSVETPLPLVDATPPVQLIGNPSKGRFHLSTCSDIQAMNPSNRIVLKNLEEARQLGLQPCAHCRPTAGLAPQKENDPR